MGNFKYLWLGPQSSDCGLLPRSRAFSCSMVFLSAAPNALSGLSGSVGLRVSCGSSSRSLVQRQSPLAALLTICLTMAWRLLIFLRPPFSAIMTVSLSASVNRLDRFLAPLGRPFGLPD